MTAPSRLIDVANAAGVSLRTASRVLNEDHRVADTTRERVRAVMQALEFQPDAIARSLRSGTDTTIGFVVESIADPFFGAVISAVEAVMARNGRSVLVASTHRDAEHESDVVARMLQRRVAGLLLAPAGRDRSWLTTSRTPVVLIDRAVPGPDVDLVDIDDRRAAFDAVTHLISHGHRRIAYIGDTPSIGTSAARLSGYRDAHIEGALEVDERLIRSNCSASEDAAEAISDLLDRHDNPDAGFSAIFSATTRASLGVVPVLHARARTDLGLVSFGDFAMADALSPAVTVVDHSGTRLGEAAAARLLARLAQPDLPAEHIQLPTPIIARGSGELRP